MAIQTRVLWSAVLTAAFALAGHPGDAQQLGRGRWDVLEVVGQHIPRFESGYIKVGERFYLVGGRQAPQPVEVFDVGTRTWKAAAVSPVTMHHFQPVVYDGKIYIVGALTGSGRGEPPLPDVYIYDPAADRWEKGPAIPADRLRGGVRSGRARRADLPGGGPSAGSLERTRCLVGFVQSSHGRVAQTGRRAASP